MGKITVKHYLNKAVKPRFNGQVNIYPIYVQIIADRVNYKMKSNFSYWDGYISEADYNSDFVTNVLLQEKTEIEKVASYLIENDKDEYLNANGFKILSANLWDTLSNNFRRLFHKEADTNIKAPMPNAFVNATFYDIDEIITFTESEIEGKFSETYRYARIGMDTLLLAMLGSESKDLKIQGISVFDFLYDTDSRKRVLEAVMRGWGFHGGDERQEYENVLTALESVIFIEE